MSETTDSIELELSRRLFHLQTLYDASRELLGLSEMEAILRTFLLTALGASSTSARAAAPSRLLLPWNDRSAS